MIDGLKPYPQYQAAPCRDAANALHRRCGMHCSSSYGITLRSRRGKGQLVVVATSGCHLPAKM